MIAKTQVGDFEVVVLKDGETEFGNEIFPDIDEKRIAELLAKAGQSKIKSNFHAVLLRSASNCILVDAGAGDFFGPSGGQFPEAIEEAGLVPDDVNTVVVTHLHPDHIGGMVNSDESVVFPNAEVLLSKLERDFWTDDSNFTGADSTALEWQKFAKTVLKAYNDQVTTVAMDGDIASGVSLIELAGHTVGHVGVRLESNQQQFIYTADILHSQDLQLADPRVSAVMDVDKSLAEKTRIRLLDMIATDRILFSGCHFLDCQLGYLERYKNGYRLCDS